VVDEETGERMTDQQLRELVPLLARLPHLRTLSIESDEITNAGLDQLTSLSGLEQLDLRCPQVTDWGITRLRTAMTALEVHDD